MAKGSAGSSPCRYSRLSRACLPHHFMTNATGARRSNGLHGVDRRACREVVAQAKESRGFEEEAIVQACQH